MCTLVFCAMYAWSMGHSGLLKTSEASGTPRSAAATSHTHPGALFSESPPAGSGKLVRATVTPSTAHCAVVSNMPLLKRLLQSQNLSGHVL